MTDGMKFGIAADKQIQRRPGRKKRSGKEVRECATKKERLSALRLCFSVDFVCWLRALKRRLLASLFAAAEECWTKGRVHGSW